MDAVEEHLYLHNLGGGLITIILSIGEGPALPDEPEAGISLASVAFIQQQLEDCLSSASHAPCRVAQAGNGFEMEWPRRVLEFSDGVAILVDFEPSMIGEYVALSYCWGGTEELEYNPPLKATASTWSSLRTGIPVKDLPLTMHQATKICRRLGIPYIWIDALCILQDSVSDWESESRKMATIYSVAKLTIFAASSTSCHSGFLSLPCTINADNRDRPQLRFQPDSPFKPADEVELSFDCAMSQAKRANGETTVRRTSYALSFGDTQRG
ncbi:heterokaryon incompatibility protein-domain-containing protein [Lasiosphaeris hirsuta]|uniref:Heterokaryon incompatibility protein-domain-containing protein n=1 Tax=Lasiosphaeris hirsuta TaxID=260670 RepID=A0AA40BDC0_9PEZI|nr:heterokaryon incompatibility protein-domain-containing protein [Lasiosphaeris hirsuta]